MSEPKGDQNKIWWAVGMISALIFSGVLLLLSYKRVDRTEAAPGRSIAETKIGLTRLAEHAGGRVVAEEAQFFDPTPLFLPTEWNADQKSLPPNVLTDPGQMLIEFPSKLQFAEEGVKLEFADRSPTSAITSDAISVLGGEVPLQGIGRGSDEVDGLTARGGYLLVKSADPKKRAILAQSIPDASPPEDNWKPMEFMAVVNRAGLVGSLSLIERSGHESVDRYFQNYLVEIFRLGERLSPGFYRISVGP